jgi:hypothetical protein
LETGFSEEPCRFKRINAIPLMKTDQVDRGKLHLEAESAGEQTREKCQTPRDEIEWWLAKIRRESAFRVGSSIRSGFDIKLSLAEILIRNLERKQAPMSGVGDRRRGRL